jgi:hypothetical protein
MERTQKNKATMFHIGILKARLAKLRRELLTPKGGGGGPGEGERPLSLSLVSPNLTQHNTTQHNLHQWI